MQTPPSAQDAAGVPDRFALRARAFSRSTSRSFGGAEVTSSASRCSVAWTICATARSSISALAREGLVIALTLRTCCSAASCTSCEVASGLHVVEGSDAAAHAARLARGPDGGNGTGGGDGTGRGSTAGRIAASLEAMTTSSPLPHDPAPGTPELRLATYGSLIPGAPNHHEVADLGGRWLTGYVTGHLHEEGWGAAIGYPAIALAADGDRVDVHVLESDELPVHWDRLDAFEGVEYARTPVTVHTAEGEVAAFIYTRARGAAS